VLPPRAARRFARPFPSFVAIRWAGARALRKVGLAPPTTNRRATMKRIALPVAALLATAAGATFAAEPSVAVDVRGLPIYLQEKIREEAAKGVVPLRQYLGRTYPVHQLRVDAVIAKDDAAARIAREQQPSQLAQVEARPKD
jgi:hypothetical protein